ncbi:translation initiation factor eIF-2B subunit beta isoform X2 [Sorghum bicolor]|uniref:translation initiation factor eIF-2B subunit beta isoform X2 n=1 Tax=Sorghum bicolor TaxID=4558 RepID=UPI000B424A27|nr:translation initiation factor eIF-2B subunit beta isoform X2 [Sorghum bicolor]|eukprot:XP_021306578.1 translation initiation factor eIF-2B subunit beta isoform X2 [Sorghum bicolor]
MPDVQPLVSDFVLKLKRRKVEGSHAVARQTAELLRSVVSQHRMVSSANQAAALADAVRAVGEQLIAANPVELAVGNIVRRVLHIIKEEDISSTAVGIEGLSVTVDSDDEYDSEHDDRPALSAAVLAAHARNALRAPSLQTLLEDIPVSPAVSRTASSTGDSDGKSKSGDKSSTRKLKHDVIAAIGDLIDEIDSCYEPISEQAVELIHQNEVILTLGRSRTVKEFLYAAKEKKRSFRVFVAEGAPRYQGHVLAKELVEKGVQTTVITDSAVFAMISRVNMVIVGAHAIMANGGVIAPVGMNMVALAAQRHAVPFVVVAGSHKLCPLYPHNPEVLLNELKSPSDLLDFGEFSDCMNFSTQDGSPLLNVVNPTFDYVPPKLVSLFITDTGGHSPSYMYRLIAEYYSADDLVVRRKATS